MQVLAGVQDAEEHGHGCGCSHGEGHSHQDALGHSHLSHADTAQKLAVSLGLTLIILAAEITGGLVSHSLALLSDGAHMVTDVAALALAWYAQRQGERRPTPHRTYGFHRAGIMAAMINALTLLGVSGFIMWEAVLRIQAPAEKISTPIMSGVALVALIVNLGIAWILSRGENQENLNVRSALLHVLGDAAASAGVIAAGIVIALTGWMPIDPLLSIVIAVVIVKGAVGVLSETHNVLMESAPHGVTAHELEESLASLPGVKQVHHVHIWMLSPGMNALSGHVVLEDQSLSQTEGILQSIHAMLRTRYHVDHATIQFEHRQCEAACALHPGAR